MSHLLLVRNNKHFKTFVDDEYMGFVYKSDFEKLGLDKSEADSDEIESVIDENVIHTLKDIVSYRAFDRAVDYVKVVDSYESEIRFKLKKKNFPDYAIDAAVELMYEYNYFDDRRYAESYIRSYMSTKSRSLLEKELSIKKLNIDNIRELIDEVFEDENGDEDEIIERLLEKRFKNQDLEDIKVKRRAMGFLVRHGFSFEMINKHLT